MHAYERSTPVNNYTVDACGAVHITIGDAGNSEGLSFLNNFNAHELSSPHAIPTAPLLRTCTALRL